MEAKMATVESQKSELANATVVVVHGIGGKRLWMFPLCQFLRRQGMEVINWSYPSFSQSIAHHGLALAEFIRQCASARRPIHIVAHSMGAVVVRSALQELSRSLVRRVVMLAPPNRGAPLATWMSPLLGRFCQPIRDLSTDANSYVSQLPLDSTHDIGIVAAKYDCLVPRGRTRLGGAEEYLEFHPTHNSLLLSRRVAVQTLGFLQRGEFSV